MNIGHLIHIHYASTCFKVHHPLSTTQGVSKNIVRYSQAQQCITATHYDFI